MRLCIKHTHAHNTQSQKHKSNGGGKAGGKTTVLTPPLPQRRLGSGPTTLFTPPLLILAGYLATRFPVSLARAAPVLTDSSLNSCLSLSSRDFSPLPYSRSTCRVSLSANLRLHSPQSFTFMCSMNNVESIRPVDLLPASLQTLNHFHHFGVSLFKVHLYPNRQSWPYRTRKHPSI